MKNYFLSAIFFLSSFIAIAQTNLVINYSFEVSDAFCNTGIFLSYSSSPPWRAPTLGSPDLFKNCAPNPYYKSPKNWVGYQKPRTDSSYAGICLYWPPPQSQNPCITPNYAREYLQGKLQSKLEANKKYCVSFYVSLSDSSAWASDDIGIYLSSTKVSDTTITSNSACKNFPYIPQIVNPKANIITDTVNWVLIKGIYTAQGGEEYLTIGNFAGDTIDILQVNWETQTYKYSYYYIDDVSVIEIAEAEAGQNKTICRGESAVLTASGGGLYAWSGGQSAGSITVSPTANTTYFVTATDTICGCTSRDSVVISVVGWQLAVGSSKSAICNGESVTLTANGGVSYTWSGGLGAGSTVVVSPNVNTTYTVTGTDSAGCSGTASASVAVFSSQFSVFSFKSNLCNGESAVLTASGGVNYAWSGGQSAESITVSPVANTVYRVTVTDSCSYSQTLQTEIKVKECKTNLEVPNVVTPNEDNINDVFRVNYTGEFESFSVKIFNRWGVKMFESKNINFTWDARTNSGYVILDGTYYYIISATGKDGKEWEMHGAVTIIR
ncbi:MAG: gliding motility-associated C-terminal domain-containing protein [Bacteroidales bacterium]|jgi:gliding motility-associated-like protein